jgi:hypothetical protein
MVAVSILCALGFAAAPAMVRLVERTIAWLNRCRRLAKDWENLNRNALASPQLNPSHSAKTLQTRLMFPDIL